MEGIEKQQNTVESLEGEVTKLKLRIKTAIETGNEASRNDDPEILNDIISNIIAVLEGKR